MMRARALAPALLLALSFAPEAQAQDEDLGRGRVIAVQDRPYRFAHEFTLTVGVLPMDAFYTGLSLGGSYTLHFTELVSWEALSFHYSNNVSKGLDTELTETWGVRDAEENELQYMLASHVVLSPFAGKLTVMNSSIVSASTYLAIGGGTIRYQEEGFRPLFSIGPGLRFAFGQVVSSRLDVRGILTPSFNGGADFILHVGLSVSFNVGAARPIPFEDREAEADLVDPFKELDELYPLSNPDRGRRKEDKR